jgi:hypothetical protein
MGTFLMSYKGTFSKSRDTLICRLICRLAGSYLPAHSRMAERIGPPKKVSRSDGQGRTVPFKVI